MLRVQGGVLFDIDGTLLVGSVSHLELLGETLGRHLGRPVPIHVQGERPMLDGTDFSGWIDVQIVRTVLQRGSTREVSQAEVAAVMAAYERDYRADARLGAARVVDGAVACLERLRDAGVPIGLVTGNASFVARTKLGALGLDGFFTFAPDLGFGDWRQDRAAVATAAVNALAQAGGDLASLAYVGDTPRDMQAALAAGVRPIGVLTGTSTADQLTRAGAEVVIGSVADLYPPEHEATAA